jgi:DNA-binding NtrC family response regulator
MKLTCRIVGMKPMPSQPALSPDSADPILLVDDESLLLEVYTAVLSPRFSCTTATSTREAEFILRQQEFKVVITDHLMPGGNGMSFLVRVREEYPRMQRILVTGYMKPEMLLRSVSEATLFRYLVKPVAMEELARVTEAAVHHHDRLPRVTPA